MSFNGLEFTIDSFDKFYDTVDADFFKQADAEAIYEHLYQKIHIIPFGDYLKRYIYKLAGLEGDYNEIDLREYQYIIVNSFKERNTPNSFEETSAKLSALSKNWLTRRRGSMTLTSRIRLRSFVGIALKIITSIQSLSA